MLERPNYYFTVIWGESFTTDYLATVLPSFLAKGNFDTAKRHPHDRYLIYTTAADANRIRQSPEYQRASALLPVELRIFNHQETVHPDGNRLNRWEANKVVNYYYGAAIPETINARAALVLLSPDQPWPRGSFDNIREIIASGKRVISFNSITVDPVSFIPDLRRYYDSNTGAIDVPGRVLVETSLRHLHANCMWQNATSPYFAVCYPTLFWWPVDGEGIIFHIIGGDPKVIVHTDPTIPWPLAYGTEQLEHVYALGITDDEFYYCQDSDVMMTIAQDFHRYGDKDFGIDPNELYRPVSPVFAAWWLRRNMSVIKRNLLKRPIRLHHGEMTARWRDVEEKAEQFMSQVFSMIDLLDRSPDIDADLELTFDHAKQLRQKQIEWQERAKGMRDSLGFVWQDIELSIQLAKSHGVRGEYQKSIEYIFQLLQVDSQRAVRAVSEIATILTMTSRKEEAAVFVQACEQVMRMRPGVS